ncbi:Arm DNA-binding domain-containing protein [Ruoffia sp. FAM 20858]|uniref:Arm DNA-binding domain-containing protein n=1 Tax=Ruoffia sp. FAM 20858 TaxID=3259516 RepID=UPI00388A4B25
MAYAREYKGRWYYRIKYTDSDGKKRDLERGTYKTRELAISAGEKMEAMLKKRPDVLKGEMLVSDYFKEWYEQVISLACHIA